MCDILISVVVLGLLPFILRSPRIGAYVWAWLSMMNPQRAAYRYVLSVPFSMLAASDVGGHRKLIRDGKTGMQFKIGSAMSPAETIMNLLAARDSWAEPRAAGRRYVETERNWRNSVGRYADIYHGIIPRSVA